MDLKAVPVSRRYSGVIMTHPRFASTTGSPCDLWRSLTGDDIGGDANVQGWHICEAFHVSPRNYYSEALANPDLIRRPGGYVHDVIVAGSQSGTGRIFIATPYVQFLRDLLRKVESELGQPRPAYLAMNMAAAFLLLADTPKSFFHIRQFSVQHRGSSSADRLSVSGRSPLKSDLGSQFAVGAGEAAYGIRAEVRIDATDFRTNINLDRHGNIWWFHRGPDSLANLFAGLNLLLDLNLGVSTRTIPPDHKDQDEF